MMKNLFIKSGIALSLVMVLAGCQSEESSQANQSTESTEVSQTQGSDEY